MHVKYFWIVFQVLFSNFCKLTWLKPKRTGLHQFWNLETHLHQAAYRESRPVQNPRVDLVDKNPQKSRLRRNGEAKIQQKCPTEWWTPSAPSTRPCFRLWCLYWRYEAFWMGICRSYARSLLNSGQKLKQDMELFVSENDFKISVSDHTVSFRNQLSQSSLWQTTNPPRDGFKPKTCADCVVNSSRSSRSFAYSSTLKLSILFLARNLQKTLGKSIFIYYIMKYCKILEKKTQLNSASSWSSRSWLIVSELTVAWQGLTEKFDTNHRKPWQVTPVIWPCGDNMNSPKGWNRLHEPK